MKYNNWKTAIAIATVIFGCGTTISQARALPMTDPSLAGELDIAPMMPAPAAAPAANIDPYAGRGSPNDNHGGPRLRKVSELKRNGWHNEYVTLRGRIVQRIGHERFIFQDETGRIHLEIDDDDYPWGTNLVNRQVEVFGEFERKYGFAKVEAKGVRIL